MVCLHGSLAQGENNMVRGTRISRHRGGDGPLGPGGRGSNGNLPEPDEPEPDPFCNLLDDEEEMAGQPDDEYIWPTVEEDEDD